MSNYLQWAVDNHVKTRIFLLIIWATCLYIGYDGSNNTKIICTIIAVPAGAMLYLEAEYWKKIFKLKS